jgi:hypothetical protein
LKTLFSFNKRYSQAHTRYSSMEYLYSILDTPYSILGTPYCTRYCNYYSTIDIPFPMRWVPGRFLPGTGYVCLQGTGAENKQKSVISCIRNSIIHQFIHSVGSIHSFRSVPVTTGSSGDYGGRDPSHEDHSSPTSGETCRRHLVPRHSMATHGR